MFWACTVEHVCTSWGTQNNAFRRFSFLAMFDCFATLLSPYLFGPKLNLKANLLARGKVFELQVVI